MDLQGRTMRQPTHTNKKIKKKLVAKHSARVPRNAAVAMRAGGRARALPGHRASHGVAAVRAGTTRKSAKGTSS